MSDYHDLIPRDRRKAVIRLELNTSLSCEALEQLPEHYALKRERNPLVET
ncbi:MAG TPA: hypothetical protein VK689_16325 [Armatimonadota bacterium]|nr:hypothetical protein [Armatimonadota bacterium]